jgi:UDP-glucuronate decarboxylase
MERFTSCLSPEVMHERSEMRILVTGAAGLIGSHLVDALLADNHYVIGLDNLFTGSRSNLPLDNPDFEFVRHDVCDPFHFDVDQIFHLACPASPVHYQRNAVRTIKTAFVGTYNALECARNTVARVLIASTSEVYGDPLEHPQREEYWGHVNPVGSRSCYDEGKRAAESLAVSWVRQYGTSVRIARIFNTYGPRMALHDGRVIPGFIAQAMAGEPLTVFGDGQQTRSFCYVDDMVDGLVRLMGCDCLLNCSGPVNLGNPDERSILSVAEAISGSLSWHTRIEHRPLPQDDPHRRCPDISRAKSLLGWEPTIGFEEGIRRTVEYYRGNP